MCLTFSLPITFFPPLILLPMKLFLFATSRPVQSRASLTTGALLLSPSLVGNNLNIFFYNG